MANLHKDYLQYGEVFSVFILQARKKQMAKTEKYSDRDLLIKMVEAQEQLLEHFSNGKFVGQLKEGIKEQTAQIMKEFNNVDATTKEVRGVMNWVFRAMIPIIYGLIALLTKVIFFSGS